MANLQFAGLGRSALGPAFLLGGVQQGTGVGSVAGGSLPPQFPRGRIASNTPGPTSSRHGSGAPYTIRSSSRTQDRAERRSAREETLQPNEAAVRVLPVGPQEAADWAQALDTVISRIVTVERTVREQAQFISSVKDRVDSIFGQTQLLTKQANSTERNLTEACANIVDRYTPKAEHADEINSIANNFGAINARLEALNDEFQILQAHVIQGVSASAGHPTSQLGQPPTYAMNTPVNPERLEVADNQDQWEATMQRGGSPLRSEIPQAPTGAAPPPAVVESQRMYCVDQYVEPSRRAEAMAPPQCQVPQTWLPQGQTASAHQAPPMNTVQQSPFNNSFNSPLPTQCERQQQLVHHQNMQQQFQSMHGMPPRHNYAGVPPQFNSGEGDKGKMGNQEAINRKSESLRKFSGHAADFYLWSEHFIDHMSKVHTGWRYVLEWFAKPIDDVSMARLRHDTLGPFHENAWELSEKLEQVIVDWLPEVDYGRRIQLCNGEKGNGLAMWRRLHADYKGTGDMVEFAGIEVLREFKACTKISDLSNHMDTWKSLLDTYGQEIHGAPKLLRSMFLNIIPRELKTEIIRESSLVYAGHIELMAWCRARATVLQQERLAEVTKKHLEQMTHRRSITAVVGQKRIEEEIDENGPDQPPKEEEPPAWARQLIAAMAPPPSAHAVTRPPRKPSPTGARGRSPGSRADKDRRDPRKRSPSQSKRLVEWNNKCYHCGSEDHGRETCSSFNKMMKEANPGKEKKDWKPPSGYKSALRIAVDKAKAKDAKDRGIQPVRRKVASVSRDDDSASDDDDFSDSGARAFSIQAITRFRPVTKGQLWSRAQVSSDSRSDRINAVNQFHGLGDDQEYDPETLQALSSWANVVRFSSTKKNKKTSLINPAFETLPIEKAAKWIEGPTRPKDQTMILRSAKDVNRASDIIAALPESRKGIAKVAKKLETVTLQPDEILCMVDSGSVVHAIDADEELPDHHVEAPSERDQQEVAETACGGLLHKLGKVRVQGTIDGQNVGVTFDHMKVKIPILSVRKLIKDNNEVYINRKGGVITNLDSGKQIKFFNHQGVYYLKLKIHDPKHSQFSDQNESDFVRRGA